MHDPGDECECSECRVRAIWPAEQITRDDRPERDPHFGEKALIRDAIADMRLRIDRIEALMQRRYSDKTRT